MEEHFTTDKKVSLAIITFQQYEMLLKSFEAVVDDERISEITICDDASDKETTYKLEDWLEYDAPQKIKLAQNTEHLGAYLNQHRAILFSDGEWVISFSSEHTITITKKDVDKIFNQSWKENVILQPSSDMIFVNRKRYLKVFNTDKNEPSFEAQWLAVGNKINSNY